MSMETRTKAEYAASQKVCAYLLNRARYIIDRQVYEVLDCVDSKDEQPIRDAWEALRGLIIKEETQCGINYRKAINGMEGDYDNVPKM